MAVTEKWRGRVVPPARNIPPPPARVPQQGFTRIAVRHDLFSGHANEYAAFRPKYPATLFDRLAQLAPHGNLAWDCACGSGQATIDLARRFVKVIATDASVAQLRHAPPLAHVEYLAAAAEHCPLADGSVDLVAVAQALHWFDLSAFFAEARRVLRPGGALAAWAYNVFQIEPKVDAVVAKLYDGILGEYWSPERRLVDEGYRGITVPLQEVPVAELEMCEWWTLRQAVAYLNTWSSVKKYERAHGVNPVSLVENDLREAWGDSTTPRAIRWPLHLRVFRV